MIRFKMNPKNRHEEIIVEDHEKISEEQFRQIFQIFEDAALPLWSFQNLLALDGDGPKADLSDVLEVLLHDLSDKLYNSLKKLEVEKVV